MPINTGDDIIASGRQKPTMRLAGTGDGVAGSSRSSIFVASAAMEHPVSFTAKFEWLREHFPDIAPSHCVFCGDKGVLGVDYLIDDSSYQLVRFRGEPIIFTAPHNVNETRFRRVADWPDAVTQLMGAA